MKAPAMVSYSRGKSARDSESTTAARGEESRGGKAERQSGSKLAQVVASPNLKTSRISKKEGEDARGTTARREERGLETSTMGEKSTRVLSRRTMLAARRETKKRNDEEDGEEAAHRRGGGQHLRTHIIRLMHENRERRDLSRDPRGRRTSSNQNRRPGLLIRGLVRRAGVAEAVDRAQCAWNMIN